MRACTCSCRRPSAWIVSASFSPAVIPGAGRSSAAGFATPAADGGGGRRGGGGGRFGGLGDSAVTGAADHSQKTKPKGRADFSAAARVQSTQAKHQTSAAIGEKRGG